jgi:hypothetical protein
VTSDFLVDCLTCWWESVRARYAHITMLVLNLDNGPENHSHRTQFMARLVAFVAQFGTGLYDWRRIMATRKRKTLGVC